MKTTIYSDFRKAKFINAIFGPNPVLKASLQRQNQKIIHNTAKYIENQVFGIVEFVFEAILTVVPTNIGPQGAEARIWAQKYLLSKIDNFRVAESTVKSNSPFPSTMGFTEG